MANALLDHYSGRRAEVERQIQTITDLAFQRDDKQLTDQDREQLSVLQSQLDAVTRDIEQVSKRSDLSRQASDALKLNDVRASQSGHQYRSAGEVVWDLLHRGEDSGAQQRWDQFRAANPEGASIQSRAAQHMGTTAAATTPTAGGFGALFVSPVRGPVLSLGWQGTPFLDLLGAQPISAPGPFMRPRIIDPDFYTAAGPQAGGLQKGELPSKKWDYTSDLVTPSTVGNYINLSLQAQTWVPSALQTVIDHLTARTQVSIEKAAVAAAAATDGFVALPAGATAAEVQTAVWQAMADVFTATGQPAQWMVAGPLGAAMLGSTVDLAGRPLFPIVGANNALGTANAGQIIAPFGLAFAITPAITDTTLYVGNSIGLEAYTYSYPILDAVEPSILGRQIASAADVAFYSVPTAEGAPATHAGIVRIAPA